MKKRFLILFIAIVVCVVITFLAKKPTAEKFVKAPEQDASLNLPPVVPVTDWQIVFQDNWKFSVPGNTWDVIDTNDPDTKLVMKSPNEENTIFFVKEQVMDTYQEYVISTIQSWSDNEALIISMQQVIVNGTKFIKVHMLNKGTEIVWSWITVKNGFGYVLACGGEVNADGRYARQDYCQSIANTFYIN